jgi:hypothetical protein
MAAATAYCDAGGKEGITPSVTVATVAATVDSWKIFEHEWCCVLRTYGLEYFHSSEYVARKPPFDKLTEAQRVSLIRDLIQVARPFLVSAHSTTVYQDDYDQANGLFKIAESLGGPFAIAVGSAMKDVWNCEKIRKETSLPVQIFIEDGDKGRGAVKEKLCKFAKISRKLQPTFLPWKSDVDGVPVYVRQFELADLVAFEWGRGAANRRHRMVADRYQWKPLRKSAEALQEALGVNGGASSSPLASPAP